MLEIVKRSAFEPCLGSVDVGSVLENPRLGLSLAPSANLKISLRCIGNMQYISHPPLPLSSLSVTPRPRTNAILVFVRKKSLIFGETESEWRRTEQAWIFGIWQTHLESLSTWTVLSHWALKARLENHFRHSLSWLQCCECRDAIVQVTDADLHFYAVRALPGKEIGMQFQTGVTGKGWGKGAV